MTDFSSQLPTKLAMDDAVRDLGDVDEMEKQLKQMSVAHANPATVPVVKVDDAESLREEDVATLGVLAAVREALSRTSAIKTDPPLPDDQLITPIDLAIQAWEHVEVPKTVITSERYKEFFQLAREYRVTALGALRILKFDAGVAAEADALDIVLADFKGAENPRQILFPRMYMNYAVALERKIREEEKRYDGAPPAGRDPIWTKILDLFEQQRTQTKRAWRMDQSGRFISNLHNNRAFYALLEAQLYHKNNQPEQCRAALAQARDLIAKAVNTAPFHPASFCTRAEIECVAISLGLVDIKEPNGERLKAKILDDIRVAAQNGHFARIRSREELLKEFKNFNGLEKVAPETWQADLYAAARVEPGTTESSAGVGTKPQP
jgi:hypothetical protein